MANANRVHVQQRRTSTGVFAGEVQDGTHTDISGPCLLRHRHPNSRTEDCPLSAPERGSGVRFSMDLALNETQQMLRNTARDFMAREAPREAVVALQKSETGFRPEVWETAAGLGWLGMLVPE